MKSTLKANEKQLQNQIDFGNVNLDFGSKVTLFYTKCYFSIINV